MSCTASHLWKIRGYFFYSLFYKFSFNGHCALCSASENGNSLHLTVKQYFFSYNSKAGGFLEKNKRVKLSNFIFVDEYLNP
jgi:hypothetical protein